MDVEGVKVLFREKKKYRCTLSTRVLSIEGYIQVLKHDYRSCRPPSSNDEVNWADVRPYHGYGLSEVPFGGST